MQARIFKWIDQHKSEDTALIHFLKLVYSIGQKSWLHAIISAVLGIIIPIMFDTKNFVVFGVCIFLMILDIIYACICNNYNKAVYLKRKFAHEILLDQSALLKSILIEIENNNKMYFAN